MNAIIIAAATVGGMCGLCAVLVLAAAWRLRKRRREEEQEAASTGPGKQKRKVGASGVASLGLSIRIAIRGAPIFEEADQEANKSHGKHQVRVTSPSAVHQSMVGQC